MRTLLVLAEHPDFAEAVRSALSQEQYRVVHRTNVEEAEPLLVHGVADACILDLELSQVQGLWALEKLRRRAPRCPVIIYAGAQPWEWEEEAYLKGAVHVLAKPVRPRLLTGLLERVWGPISLPTPVALPAPTSRPATPAAPPQRESGVVETPLMGPLRSFSGILTHSLNAEGMLRQFLLLLRELLSINRVAVFLRPPATAFDIAGSTTDGGRLRAVCAFGISQSLLQHIELSTDAGIGRHIFRLGRILRRQAEEIRGDLEAHKEFELLGGQVAVPILDRESVLGVAVLDGRITGEPLLNSELELIFHLLEQLGLAIRNIWLHDQLAANHQMMADILRELSSACIVVGRDLTILHANKTARKYFASVDRRELEFSDLPEIIGAKIYQVLKTGSAVTTFRYEPESIPGTIYKINVVPFQRSQTGLPASALLTADDVSQSEQFSRLEIETANLRLIKSMADRLTHEIGNAMVPLSTHQQLLADKWKDGEFRASLDLAMADGVKRVTRLINQMRFLARDSLLSAESFPVVPLIEEAYQEACKHQPTKSAQLRYDNASKPIVLKGDRAALKHALTEVMLNALQANPADPRIGVRLQTEANGNAAAALQIEVQDNGSGFTPEAMEKAPAPFFTTRNVGLGLGLTVTQRIIETHHGKLEIVRPKSGQAGIVRISLPLEAAGGLSA